MAMALSTSLSFSKEFVTSQSDRESFSRSPVRREAFDIRRLATLGFVVNCGSDVDAKWSRMTSRRLSAAGRSASAG